MKKLLKFYAPKKAISFYVLSFTWGLLTTFIGVIIALVLRILKYKPIKFG